MDHFNVFNCLGGRDRRRATPRVGLGILLRLNRDSGLAGSDSLSVLYGLDRFKLRGWRR